MTPLRILAAMLLAAGVGGCSERIDGLREVRIVNVVPEHSEGWSTTYHHVIVEDTTTRQRNIMVGQWGNTGDVFTVSKWSFNR